MSLPVISLSDLPDGALLGLDPGSKTIGVAAIGAARTMAAAVETIQRTKMAADAARVFALYDERACAALVIGLPLNMDGSEGPRAQSARAFARNLMNVRNVPIVFHDERLSTFAVEQKLASAGMSRDRIKAVVDAHAAAYILQTALEAKAKGEAG